MASSKMIIRKRLIVNTVLLCSLCWLVQSQASDYGKANQAIGFGGGSAQGPGITYRNYRALSFIQGQFFARDDSRDQLTDLMLGISYGKVISQITVVKAMAPTTLLFVSSADARFTKDRIIGGINSQPEEEKSLHIGAGVALDIGNTFSPGLVFSLGTNYVLALIQKEQKSEWNLAPHINVGILYNW